MTSTELLSLLLSGEEPTAEHLRELVSDRVLEDEHLEYKHGEELAKEKGKAGARTLRKYVTGFANSLGGVLVVGVDAPERSDTTDDEPHWRVTGCERKGAGTLKQWAATCLGELAQFIPPPRIHEVADGDLKTLVIAVERNENASWAPVREGSGFAWYIRMGDTTVEAPYWMVTDVALGRRRVPVLVPRIEKVRVDDAGTLSVAVSVHNDGIAWVDDISIGVVHWYNKPMLSLRSRWYFEEPSSQVLHQIQKGRAPGGWMLRFQCEQPKPAVIPPLQHRTVRMTGISTPATRWFRWHGALCLSPKGSAPSWFQIRLVLAKIKTVVDVVENDVVKTVRPIVEVSSEPDV